MLTERNVQDVSCTWAVVVVAIDVVVALLLLL